jgi:hypothetical protein
VAIGQTEVATVRRFMDRDNITDIHTYLRICVVSHNLRYVWISVMLSLSMKRLSVAASVLLMAT